MGFVALVVVAVLGPPAGAVPEQDEIVAALPVAPAGMGGPNGVDQGDFQMPFPCGQVWGASTYANHPAVDWNGVGPAAGAADHGLEVVASLGGVVFASGFRGGYGEHVVIDHGDGWTTLYAHLSSIAVVPGQRVAMGTPVGAVGNTGTSGGPHLHWEQRYLGRALPDLHADGALIITTHGSPGPTYTSANCPASAFGVSLVPAPGAAGGGSPAPPTLAKATVVCTEAGCAA